MRPPSPSKPITRAFSSNLTPCFSWRPRKSIALVEGTDGIHWGVPVIALGPNPATDWEAEVNRPVVVKRPEGYHMWYTGQARGHSWIGHATSPDGKTWTRTGKTKVAPGPPTHECPLSRQKRHSRDGSASAVRA